MVERTSTAVSAAATGDSGATDKLQLPRRVLGVELLHGHACAPNVRSSSTA